MPDRPKLEIVDDPVTGLGSTSTPRPAPPARPHDAAFADPPDQLDDDSQHEPEPQPEDAPPAGRRPRRGIPSDPAETVRLGDPVRSYGQEQKRAVFGRVPRSLSRRLERAVFELRDEFEDLTQEQLLAALLHEHVDAGDPAALAQLTDTVRRYRRELGRP
jgi:hypothetical protein